MSIEKAFSITQEQQTVKAEKYLSARPDIHACEDSTLTACESESERGTFYIVSPNGTCTCPWARKINPMGLFCKHAEALRILGERK